MSELGQHILCSYLHIYMLYTLYSSCTHISVLPLLHSTPYHSYFYMHWLWCWILSFSILLIISLRLDGCQTTFLSQANVTLSLYITVVKICSPLTTSLKKYFFWANTMFPLVFLNAINHIHTAVNCWSPSFPTSYMRKFKNCCRILSESLGFIRVREEALLSLFVCLFVYFLTLDCIECICGTSNTSICFWRT